MTIIYLRVKNGKVTNLKDIERKIIKYGAPAALVIGNALTQNVYAANLKASLKPIITTLQDLAYPLTYGFMIVGTLKYIAGQSQEGKKTIKDAVAGYILVQWIPWIFGLIEQIGKSR